jgi:quinol-cytochrome oxidoreductase complex cytochrome b subunit
MKIQRPSEGLTTTEAKPVPHAKSQKAWARWLDERLGAGPLLEHLREKDVPHHRYSMWYFFGGMTLFLFTVQVVTGILLLFYYSPGANTAFESVQYIMGQVKFGWLVRSIHSWSANLMIGSLFLHMFSVFLLKGYRSPRELTWVTGVLLFFVVLGFGFSGYLLPWNQLAFFATKVGTEIAGAVPFVGHQIVRLLRGGDDVTGLTLSRFFALHVAILPIVAVVLLSAHLLLIQKQGISVPLSIEERKRPVIRLPFFPDFFLRELIGWYIVVAALAALAALDPWPLGVKADPLAPAPEGIKPEWFFLWLYQTLRYLPAKILGLEGEMVGVCVISIAFALWIVVPFLDKKASAGRRSPAFTAIGWGAIFYIIGMTLWGHYA